jgi:hypothetical protein
MGLPTASIHTQVFAPLVKKYAGMAGKPGMRFAFVPQPISREPAEKCREYIEGKDPVTGKAVLKEIEEALTKPLTGEDKISKIEERPATRRLGPDTEENLHSYFMENGLTDYLPIVLPTEARVSEMLKGTSHQPGESAGEIRAGYESYGITVEKAAAIAVMAGAKPEYLPVILAIAASGISCIATSTNNFARMITVNGPISKEIKMNAGTGALSPLNQANAVIGRAGTLLALNLGGGKLGETYWGNQGNNLNYNNVTFAENEEALPPGWQPFHVQKGFKRDESAVSLFHGWGIWSWKNTYENEKHKAILQMANWIGPFGNRTGIGLMLDPIVAEGLVKEGFQTKEAVSEYIQKNSKMTLGEFWQYHSVETSRAAAEHGAEPYASLLKQPPETLIDRYSSPEGISILVVGGRTNEFWQAGDWTHLGSYSIDEWR